MHSFKLDRVGAVYSVRNQGNTVDEHTSIHATELHPAIPIAATKKLGVCQRSTHTFDQLTPKTRTWYCMQTVEMLLDGQLRGLSRCTAKSIEHPQNIKFTLNVSVDEP